MNTPNKLTVLRIIFVPFIVAILLIDKIPHHYLISGLLFGAASFTDYLDGKIARRDGLITDFGKFADPLADKILVIAVLTCFVELHLANAVMLIIILAREFMVTSLRLVAVESGKVIAANMWGKTKTVSQMIAIITVFVTHYFLELISIGCIPLAQYYEQIGFVITIINNVLLWFCVLMTVISGYIYMRDNIEFVRNAK